MDATVFVQSTAVFVSITAIGAWKAFYRLPVGGNQDKVLSGWFALAWLGSALVDILHQKVPTFDAAFCAYYAWKWWNSGGGDGVKNFLQSLVMKPAYAVR